MPKSNFLFKTTYLDNEKPVLLNIQLIITFYNFSIIKTV